MRTTNNSDTHVSPFVLLRGRIPSSILSREWMGHFSVPRYKVDGVVEKRATAQQKYTTNSQKTCNRKTEWKEGDFVRVKLPRAMIKGPSKFSGWKRIIQVGDSAVKLDDGKWWNKSKISLSKVVSKEDVQSANAGKRCVGTCPLHASARLDKGNVENEECCGGFECCGRLEKGG
ncbi:hypothetical protein NDU88_010204 [Pleurodeles waltl]|uniref:Uncharacterized protein n=1 Tax=Pleurodeles waltl TaxID=8319 RepID=A0AAV7S004_PLEWA|nr:hypothetical protein NDU88_010204 [Pleurodeles waltl]